MSKPALGRGLASLLQEETGRGAVKAPGLVAAKEPVVEKGAPPTHEANGVEGAESASPATTPTAAAPTVAPQVTATSAVLEPAEPSVSEAPAAAPVGEGGSVEAPVADGLAVPLRQDSPREVSVTEVAAPAWVPAAGTATPGAAPHATPGLDRPVRIPVGGPSAGQPAPVPSAGSGAAQPVPAVAQAPASASLPGWMVPALIAGDLVVVLSAILWAQWGQGWARWPWIAALFAAGCSQALVALFLTRSPGSSAARPFAPRSPSATGPAPGIRVRFVEEQIPGRRGDRR
ncbi:MAG: hypothetical protein LW626_10075 [Verrucomicrobium sp.]|jgi:hypothetical protein|nr:hypothetical protein [Verrucomicrobium sp.]